MEAPGSKKSSVGGAWWPSPSPGDPMEEGLVCLVLVGREPELMCEGHDNKSCPSVQSYQ